jgi:hypothetical protein
MKYRLILFFSLLLCVSARGQNRSPLDSNIRVWLIGFNYGFDLTGGDMAKRFGQTSLIGASFWHKTQSNWLFGLEYNFIFGSKVRDNHALDSIGTRGNVPGYVINAGGELQVLKILERGHLPMLKIGHVFPLKNVANPNSGISLIFGAGYMEHYIDYYAAGDVTPELAGDYVKGYDRFTNGLAISQAAGFMHLDRRNYLNFSLNFEVTEGFTKNRRFNFDTRSDDNSRRLDLLYGFKLYWFFPLYGKNFGSETYY